LVEVKSVIANAVVPMPQSPFLLILPAVVSVVLVLIVANALFGRFVRSANAVVLTVLPDCTMGTSSLPVSVPAAGSSEIFTPVISVSF
jgi:hypothetical protein